MCVVSMVMDHYWDKWQPYKVPFPSPYEQPATIYPPVQPIVTRPLIPQADIDEFYKLLNRARDYDKKNNEPDCELDEKKERLKKLAKELGAEIVFPGDK